MLNPSASHWAAITNQQSRLKTCEQFARGDCPFGDDCWFIHDSRSPPASSSFSSPASINILPINIANPPAAAKYEPPHRKVAKAGPELSIPTFISSLETLITPQMSIPITYSQENSIHEHPTQTSSSKTNKPCFHFARTGSCPKGDLCSYKHEANAILPNFVKYFDPKLHPSYRTKPCYPFMFGQCLKGDSCTFKHEAPPPHENPLPIETTVDESMLPPNYRTSECKWFNSPGGCWYGSTCKFKHTPASVLDSQASATETKHPFYRTRPCAFYKRGSCPKGENCNYVHDQSSAPLSSPASGAESPIGSSPQNMATELKMDGSFASLGPLLGAPRAPGDSSPTHSRTSSTSSSASSETLVGLSPIQSEKGKLLADEILDDADDVIVYIPPSPLVIS